MFMILFLDIFIWQLDSLQCFTSFLTLEEQFYTVKKKKKQPCLFFTKQYKSHSNQFYPILETDPGKRTFYLSFGILYSLYLIGLPIVVLSALRIAPTARQKSVVGLELGIEFLGYSVLSFLLFPPRAAKYFSLAVPDVFGSASYDRL